MKVYMNTAEMTAAGNRKSSVERGKNFSKMYGTEGALSGNTAWMFSGSRLQEMDGTQETENDGMTCLAGEPVEKKSNAEKIYEAVTAGKPNPLENLREAPKVPYGYLAKDGVIEYNGVCFICDEETNSICLGDMTDKENVLTIGLSGGGHLKVNRNSIGLLSKAAGMFTPEDLNLIMRAIHQDTKIQSVKKEIEDEEASVGNQLGGEGSGKTETEELD